MGQLASRKAVPEPRHARKRARLRDLDCRRTGLFHSNDFEVQTTLTNILALELHATCAHHQGHMSAPAQSRCKAVVIKVCLTPC